MAVDGSGNVYVTGSSEGDYATIKYSPDGDTLWVRRYSGSASALAVDDSGNVYVTGWSYGSGTFDDYATIKYAPNGDSLWVRRYNGPGNDYDLPFALALDGDGNVYVTGESYGSGTNYDYATIKYIQCLAKPGDVSGDTLVDLSDIILKVDFIFRGGPAPVPLCRGDDNADTKVNLADIVYEANYVFKGGPAPIKSKECCL